VTICSAQRSLECVFAFSIFITAALLFFHLLDEILPTAERLERRCNTDPNYED
jgi:hypothetical protein